MAVFGCSTVKVIKSYNMEYLAFNQQKFASVIENINKELQVKGEGNCDFALSFFKVLSMLGKNFSRQHFEILFLMFSRK